MTRGDTRAYYEEEARRGTRSSIRSGRAARRDRFVAALDLPADGRRPFVLDVGAGPGLDLAACLDRVDGIGVDLAVGNARTAATHGVPVVPGSATALPLGSRSVDAAWSFSTLMHLDADAATSAIAELDRVVVADGRLLIAQWGSPTGRVEVDTDAIPGRQRPFHLRTLEQNLRLLAPLGEAVEVECIDRFDTPIPPDGWEYHIVEIRR